MRLQRMICAVTLPILLAVGSAIAWNRAPFETRWADRAKSTSARVTFTTTAPLQSALTDKQSAPQLTIVFPDGQILETPLRKLAALQPACELIEVSASGRRSLPHQQVQSYVGTDPNAPGSLIFITQNSSNGSTVGLIDYPTGRDWMIETDLQSGSSSLRGVESNADLLTEIGQFCGLDIAQTPRIPKTESSSTLTASGPRLARVAIDADDTFAALFPSSADAAGYVAQLIAAVSAIYERDFDLRLTLGQVRIFTVPPPFSADDLGGFASYWETQEDTSRFDIVHLFSARRDLPYGGVAFLSGTCSGAFGIDAALNGFFPSPVPQSNRFVWDILVVAHEMGHNLGTLHTHDQSQYDPLIDSCAFGFQSTGTIMSYCHTTQGGILNTDLRMHRRVEEIVRNRAAFEGCLAFDCNGNAVDDSIDIQLQVSLDNNLDGIPDECQDCNANQLLDPLEIAGNSSLDQNLNGVPDECETDCNGNGMPDSYEIFLGLAEDLDGNNLPDATCDPHCSSPFVPDHQELGDLLANDLNRNRIPDDCASEDCDGNLIVDWIDLQRQRFLFTIHTNEAELLEFHGGSGAQSASYPLSVSGAASMTVTPDRSIAIVYASGETSMISPDSPEQSLGIVAGRTDIQAIGNLLVASDSGGGGTLRVLNSQTGTELTASLVLVNNQPELPVALAASPAGTLYVVTSAHSILEYQVTSTQLTLLGVRVASQEAGPLSNPVSIAVRSATQLFVASAGSNQVLEYNPTTGQFIGELSSFGVSLAGVSAVETGPDDLLYVARTSSPRVLVVDPDQRIVLGSFVRGVSALSSTSDMVFMPTAETDCNQNGRLDVCDIIDGLLTDANGNQVPDSCEASAGCCLGTTGNVDCTGQVDIADLTYLVDHLFISNAALCCSDEANIDQLGFVDIADLTRLVDHLFLSTTPLPECPL